MYPGNKIPPARLIVEEINTKNMDDEEILKVIPESFVVDLEE